MAKILTASQIKDIAVVDPNFDIGYLDKIIEYTQLIDLKPILTVDLYNDFIDNLGSLPVNYQYLLDNYIQYLLSYATLFNAIKKDVALQVSNQGVMTNRTDFSDSNKDYATNKQLLTLADMCYTYQYDLGCYLIDNKTDYPLFDIDKITVDLKFNCFFGL